MRLSIEVPRLRPLPTSRGLVTHHRCCLLWPSMSGHERLLTSSGYPTPHGSPRQYTLAADVQRSYLNLIKIVQKMSKRIVQKVSTEPVSASYIRGRPTALEASCLGLMGCCVLVPMQEIVSPSLWLGRFARHVPFRQAEVSLAPASCSRPARR